MATGEFTAPKSGIYSFSWSGLAKLNTNVRILLMKNGQEVASTWAGSTKYDSFAGTQVHLATLVQLLEPHSYSVTEPRLFE